MNLSIPRVLQMVMDSLRYWANDMHVDGFRFDLGVRSWVAKPHGFDERWRLLRLPFRQDPVLSQVKLIAEPWDIGPGRLPSRAASRRAGPNGTTATATRCARYWRGDDRAAARASRRASLAPPICFDKRGRRPWASINFVAAHDGFTLADLVTYDEQAQRGQRRGQQRRPRPQSVGTTTASKDRPTITAIREIAPASRCATCWRPLFCRARHPHAAGRRRVRRAARGGNNNAYCQDNEISWLHWEDLPESCEDLREFSRRVIALRKTQPLLRRESWRDGTIIDWYNVGGGHQEAEHWLDGNPLALKLQRQDLEAEEGAWPEVLMLFNPVGEDIDFSLPDTGGGNWLLELSTFDVERHGDVAEEGKPFRLEARSLALFRRA